MAITLTTSCASEPAAVTAADYLDALQAVCAETTAAFEALPTPPDQISIADFATSAASALDNEAEQSRVIAVPDELADDHRAFVQNTSDQATTWRSIASAGDDIGDLTVRIGQLVRGRNDLVDEMGAPECRRGTV